VSTVIALVRTAEGIAIASDGRKSNAETHEIIDDDARKIFAICNSEATLAYGLAGTIELGNHENVVLFNFEIEVPRAVERLSGIKHRNWFEYISALATEISNTVNKSLYGLGSTLSSPVDTWIFIGGLFGKHVKSAHILFCHGQTKTEATVTTHRAGVNPPPFGSLAILDLVNRKDSRFLPYSQPERDQVTTLSDAIERVRSDILAHCDPVALQVDQACWMMGGRVQLATVTPADGFHWVPGFGCIGSPEAKS